MRWRARRSSTAQQKARAPATFVNGQLLVQFKPGTSAATIQQILAAEKADHRADVLRSGQSGAGQSVLVRVPGIGAGYATQTAAQNWSTKPQVQYAETEPYHRSLRRHPERSAVPVALGYEQQRADGWHGSMPISMRRRPGTLLPARDDRWWRCSTRAWTTPIRTCGQHVGESGRDRRQRH